MDIDAKIRRKNHMAEKKELELGGNTTTVTAEPFEPVEPGPEQSPDAEKKQVEEITLKFGKGCVGEEFEGKDGNKYREILVPNTDSEDTRPWQTFVVRSNHVHDNQYGKGMWCKLPADGHTTLRRSMRTGVDDAGKPLWETTKTQVSNRDLKELVEHYKTKDRSSLKEKISEKKEEIKNSEKKAPEKAAEKSKSSMKAKEEVL